MAFDHIIDSTPFTEGREHLFVADAGAVYWLTLNGHGEQVALADRTRTEYRSEAHVVRVTGKVRNHGAAIGWGARAVLTLDAGGDDGLVEIPGVIR